MSALAKSNTFISQMNTRATQAAYIASAQTNENINLQSPLKMTKIESEMPLNNTVSIYFFETIKLLFYNKFIAK